MTSRRIKRFVPDTFDESNLRKSATWWERGFAPSSALSASVAVGLALLFDLPGGAVLGVFVLSFFVGVAAFGWMLDD